jgi:hypothetical protein
MEMTSESSALLKSGNSFLDDIVIIESNESMRNGRND